MTLTEKCLFSLVSMGLGIVDQCNIPDSVDWGALTRFSSEQRVSVSLLDALQMALDNDIVQRDSIKGVVHQLISEVLVYENNYSYLRSVFEDIDRALKEKKLNCLLLKGFSIAKDYPNPNRRYFSDIDVYSPNNHKEIDSVLAHMGGIRGGINFRHSQTLVRNVSVENHQYVTDLKGRGKLKEFEKKLNQMASNELDRCGEFGIINPSIEFAALFNIYHAHYHFIYETISLKYLCDWALFLKNHHKEIEYKNIVSEWQQMGLLPFTAVMTSLAKKCMGLPTIFVPDELQLAVAQVPSLIEEKTLRDILYPSPRPQKVGESILRGIQIAKHLLKNKWKIEYFCGQSVYSFLWSKGLSVVFGKDSGLID